MVTSPTYGSCFSINSNLTGNTASLWKSSLPGPNLGLHMELNLGQEEYMNNGLTRRAGARLNKHVENHSILSYLHTKGDISQLLYPPPGG